MSNKGRKFEYVSCPKCNGDSGEEKPCSRCKNRGMVRRLKPPPVIDKEALIRALETPDDEDGPASSDDCVETHEKAPEVEEGKCCRKPISPNELEKEEKAKEKPKRKPRKRKKK